MKLKKHELIDKVAEAAGCTKAQARIVLDSIAQVARDAIARGEEVFLFGLGKISVSHRGAKTARNIHTGETVVVPPRAVILFRPSDSIKAAANGAEA